jgi:hypothetical protein
MTRSSPHAQILAQGHRAFVRMERRPVTLSEMSYALDDALSLLEEFLPSDHATLVRLGDVLADANLQILQGRGL